MGDSPGWTLRPAAQADLSGIWRKGAQMWGVAQAERYSDSLFAVFDLLAEFPELARARPEFTPPIRIHPSGAHLILYRGDGQGAEIIRVLHARQSLSAFLQD